MWPEADSWTKKVVESPGLRGWSPFLHFEKTLGAENFPVLDRIFRFTTSPNWRPKMEQKHLQSFWGGIMGTKKKQTQTFKHPPAIVLVFSLLTFSSCSCGKSKSSGAMYSWMKHSVMAVEMAFRGGKSKAKAMIEGFQWNFCEKNLISSRVHPPTMLVEKTIQSCFLRTLLPWRMLFAVRSSDLRALRWCERRVGHLPTTKNHPTWAWRFLEFHQGQANCC